MKTAIYIEDGVTQLVITPESDFEKDAIKTLGNAGIEAKVHEGSFYDCRGGWIRQSAYNPAGRFSSSDPRDTSLIINVKKVQEESSK